ncbi:MAG: sn-glycerol-3-phosphate ABC transporter ATP-binding protein UgpC [Solirubrobacterales bacterium]|nr:sn-glycerol-3-phosphate ABC transporter ATP-binding protein UgpC [Solirubrobacterales bacterium]
MATVELDKLTKRYDDGTRAVSELELKVADRELLVVVGPSGCGKTTALRMVAGLERITSGTLRIDGRDVNDVAPKDRDVAMVFQDYALYPQMTVAQNMGFALRRRRMDKAAMRKRVGEVAEMLGLAEVLNRKPAQLSGGQRQRVAMGRALVREPAVFLMDEPLSNLDAKLRVHTRAEVMAIQRRLGVATMYVTHDQVEAMTMGDRVAVLRDGKLQQCDAPATLYDRPANVFVAGFIGSPPMNLYRGRLADDGLSVMLGEQVLPVAGEVQAALPGLPEYYGRELIVGLRPEHLVHPAGSSDLPGLVGDVKVVEMLGSEQLVHFGVAGARPFAATGEDGPTNLSTGEAVARLAARPPVHAGGSARFGVEVDQLQFFDGDSGLALAPTLSLRRTPSLAPGIAHDLKRH